MAGMRNGRTENRNYPARIRVVRPENLLGIPDEYVDFFPRFFQKLKNRPKISVSQDQLEETKKSNPCWRWRLAATPKVIPPGELLQIRSSASKFPAFPFPWIWRSERIPTGPPMAVVQAVFGFEGQAKSGLKVWLFIFAKGPN